MFSMSLYGTLDITKARVILFPETHSPIERLEQCRRTQSETILASFREGDVVLLERPESTPKDVLLGLLPALAKLANLYIQGWEPCSVVAKRKEVLKSVEGLRERFHSESEPEKKAVIKSLVLDIMNKFCFASQAEKENHLVGKIIYHLKNSTGRVYVILGQAHTDRVEQLLGTQVCARVTTAFSVAGFHSSSCG